MRYRTTPAGTRQDRPELTTGAQIREDPSLDVETPEPDTDIASASIRSPPGHDATEGEAAAAVRAEMIAAVGAAKATTTHQTAMNRRLG